MRENLVKNVKRNNIPESFVCPTCGEHPMQDRWTEYCNKTSTIDVTRDELLHACIKADSLKKFYELEKKNPAFAERFDPCMNCKHNKIVKEEGTMLEVKMLPYNGKGRPQFIEIHQCAKCGTVYKFNNNRKGMLRLVK